MSSSRDAVEQALAEFNQLRAERDGYRPASDFDDTVFTYDQGLAELGEKLADAVSAMLAGRTG